MGWGGGRGGVRGCSEGEGWVGDWSSGEGWGWEMGGRGVVTVVTWCSPVQLEKRLETTPPVHACSPLEDIHLGYQSRVGPVTCAMLLVFCWFGAHLPVSPYERRQCIPHPTV